MKPHNTIEDAVYRERQIKHWNRKWKLELIEQANPEWVDYMNLLSDWILNLVKDDGRRSVGCYCES
jgi:hypothetical protein